MSNHDEFCKIQPRFIKNDRAYLALSPLAKLLYLTIWIDGFDSRNQFIFDDEMTRQKLSLLTGIQNKVLTPTFSEILESDALFTPFLTHEKNCYKIKGLKSIHRNYRNIDAEPDGLTELPLTHGDRDKIRKEQIEIADSPKISLNFKLEEVRQNWNEVAVRHGLSQCTKLTPQRRKAITTLLKDPAWIDEYRSALGKVSESSFLLGKKGGWKISFDWIIKSDNMVKVNEDKYKDVATPAPKGNWFDKKMGGEA